MSAIAAPSLNQYFALAQARSDLDINCPATASCAMVALSSINWFVPCSKLNDKVLIAVNAFRLPTALVKDMFLQLLFSSFCPYITISTHSSRCLNTLDSPSFSSGILNPNASAVFCIYSIPAEFVSNTFLFFIISLNSITEPSASDLA